MKRWQIITLVSILAIGLLIGLIMFFQSQKKKKLITAIMAKDASKSKAVLQKMSVSQLQALLTSISPTPPPSHPGDPTTNPVNPNPAGNPPPPPSNTPPPTPGVLQRNAKLWAKTNTDIYKSYHEHETDFWGDNVFFTPGEYVGQVIQDGPFGAMIYVQNFSTGKIDQSQFFVPNKAYTITN